MIRIARTVNTDGSRTTRFIPAPANWPASPSYPPDALLADCPDAARFGSSRRASAQDWLDLPKLIHLAPERHRAVPLDQDTVRSPLLDEPATLPAWKPGDRITTTRGDTLVIVKREPVQAHHCAEKLFQLAGGIVGAARNARALYGHHRRGGRSRFESARRAMRTIWQGLVDPVLELKL